MLDGKKVLITGLTGQVGQVIARVHAPRCEMWGLARYTRTGSREETEAMGVKPVYGDVALGNFDDLPDDFDYVIHCAAVTKPGTAETGMAQNAEGPGLLLHHCRKAKAFLHVSTTVCYTDNPDPFHRYTETDHLGSDYPRAPNYSSSKVGGEAVVRTLARIHKVPVTIARLNVPYGRTEDGGMPGAHLDALVEGREILLPARFCSHSPFHEDDLAGHIEPLLGAASVPATVVNWGGDTGVLVVDWLNYMAELIGVRPNIRFLDEKILPSYILDPTRGREIGMTWTIPWKEGMRRMIVERYPDIAARRGVTA